MPPYTSSEHDDVVARVEQVHQHVGRGEPDANAAPYFAPSSAARQPSSALRVGFCVREYS